MHPYILRNSTDTGVTGFIGDIWTTLEEVLGFKYALMFRKTFSLLSLFFFFCIPRIFSSLGDRRFAIELREISTRDEQRFARTEPILFSLLWKKFWVLSTRQCFERSFRLFFLFSFFKFPFYFLFFQYATSLWKKSWVLSTHRSFERSFHLFFSILFFQISLVFSLLSVRDFTLKEVSSFKYASMFRKTFSFLFFNLFFLQISRIFSSLVARQYRDRSPRNFDSV